MAESQSGSDDDTTGPVLLSPGLPSVHVHQRVTTEPSTASTQTEPASTGTSSNTSNLVIPPQTIQLHLSRMSQNERERLLQQQLAQFMLQMNRNSGQIPLQLTQQPSNSQPGQQGAAPLTHSHTHSHAAPHNQGPANQNPHNADVVLDINGDVSGNNNNNPPPAPSNQGNRRPRRRGGLAEQIEGIPGANIFLAHMTGALPFIVLLFAKVMYNHRLGLVIFVAMFGTFYYSNASLKKLIALRENQLWTEAISGYVCIFWFLAANITFFYFMFDDQKLYRCLYFCSPDLEEMDVWSLMWVTVATDYIIKFGTVSIKSVLAMLPKHVLPCRKKGKYFLLLEMLSQFYRCLVPLPRWATFLLSNKYGGQWMAIGLFLAYCFFKGVHLKRKGQEMVKGISRFKVDVSFGILPSGEDLKSFDNICPICQDSFCDAIKLSCNHVFCDDCISLWLNREKTCPMCRAHIIDNPVWRDGATASIIQFY